MRKGQKKLKRNKKMQKGRELKLKLEERMLKDNDRLQKEGLWKL